MRWYWGMLIVTAAVALAYVGWEFASRRSSSLSPQPQPDPELARRQAELDRIYGGSELKVLMFYSAASLVPEGDPVTICYGVLNAKSVRIEPAVDGVWPSISRCVQVAPRKQTRYTLFATGRDGAVVSQSVVIRTRPTSAPQPSEASP